MKINWKIRFKNPQFWVQVAVSVLAPIMAYFGLTGAEFTTWAFAGQTLLNAISNPYVCVLVLVSVFNAIQDPTSRGLSDSMKTLLHR